MAAFVRNRVRGGSREQDRVGREIDAFGAVGWIEHQAALVLCSRRGDADHFKTPELYLRPVRRPERGRIVGRVAGGSELQEETEGGRTTAQSALELLTQEVRRELARVIGRQIGLVRLRDEVVA